MSNEIDNKSSIQNLTDTVKIGLEQFAVRSENKLRRWGGISTAAASREDKLNGFYRPRVKIDHSTGNLTVEFSPAKLMYGNNLQLVCLEDFPAVIKLLQSHLEDYGIETDMDELTCASIRRIDMGRNVYLPKSVPVKAVLATLNRCLTSGHKHQFRIQYENGGASLRIGTADTDLLFYDKLKAPEAIGGVDYINQRPLGEIMGNPDYNILRMEKRFTTRKAVKKIFAQYGITNPVLKDICHPTMGQDILLKEWLLLLDACIMPIQHDEDMLTQLLAFLQDNPFASPKQALVYLGLQQLLETNPVWDIKEQLLTHSSYQTVSNLFDEVKRWKAPNDISVQECLNWVTEGLISPWIEPEIEATKTADALEPKAKEGTDHDGR